MADRILVIEDAPELVDSLVDMLNLKGYTAYRATSGRKGLEMALAEKPDLILLDLRLPDMHGYEVVDRLQEDEWGKTANVLIITASESPDINAAETHGVPAEAVLRKEDWGIMDLADRIEAELRAA